MAEPTTQMCSGCKKYHPIEDFRERPLGKNQIKKARYKQCRSFEKKVGDKRRYKYPPNRICPGCKEDKLIDRFPLKSKKTGQREARCGICISKSRNKELRKKTNKAWRESKKGKAYIKIYRELYKPKRNANNKERLKNDPMYKVSQNTRCRIYDQLKQNGQRRTKKIKYLGTSGYFYHKWLEFQFDDDMNWSNYGSYWVLDHVKPVASFDLTIEKQIYECFDWKNTRPLEKGENGSKGDTIDESIIENHRDIVEKFLCKMQEKTGEVDDNNKYSYYTAELYAVTREDYEI